MKIPDERALADWLRFGELDAETTGPRLERATTWNTHAPGADGWCKEGREVHARRELGGARIERRRQQPAALPHRLGHIARTHAAHGGNLCADAGETAGSRCCTATVPGAGQQNGRIAGAVAVNETTGEAVRLQAPVVVLAMGGISSGHEETVRQLAPRPPRPAAMLSGAHPLRRWQITVTTPPRWARRSHHAGEMWNYAANFPHPVPHFDGHGLSAIPDASRRCG